MLSKLQHINCFQNQLFITELEAPYITLSAEHSQRD
jgi:hypothetical protein